MKATGIVRRIDHLGRIVLPKELRAQLDITEGTPLEMYTDGNIITLKRYERGCVFCGGTEELMEYRGKLACRSCMIEIAQPTRREQADETLSNRERGVVSRLRQLLLGHIKNPTSGPSATATP